MKICTSAAINAQIAEFFGEFKPQRRHRCNQDDDCLDRNYGAVLIIFDRMFGTFAAAPADEPLEYGLKGQIHSNNSFYIALSEWGRLLATVRAAKGVRSKLQVLFSLPT
ncbi:MAG: hypothetical protein AAFR90_04680 [Pseudomonadota bacterium]